jgi:hypothetical protein
MNGPKCESDNRNRFSCSLSLPKRIPQLAPVNRILPIKFRADKGHSDDPIILKGGAHGADWTIFN